MRELRVRGADVITALEAGMGHRTDVEQLQWTATDSRAIYSFNRIDFCRLHTLWLTDARVPSGIILSRQGVSVGERMRRLLRLIHRLSAEDMRNRVEFLSGWA